MADRGPKSETAQAVVEQRGPNCPGKHGLEVVFTVSVKDGNRIEVEATEGIAGLELHFTDELVDMKEPFPVVSGGNTLYKGMPKERLTVELRDGKEYWQRERTPLWEHIVEIRRTAKP